MPTMKLVVDVTKTLILNLTNRQLVRYRIQLLDFATVLMKFKKFEEVVTNLGLVKN